jgi:hypothetical protein
MKMISKGKAITMGARTVPSNKTRTAVAAAEAAIKSTPVVSRAAVESHRSGDWKIHPDTGLTVFWS